MRHALGHIFASIPFTIFFMRNIKVEVLFLRTAGEIKIVNNIVTLFNLLSILLIFKIKESGYFSFVAEQVFLSTFKSFYFQRFFLLRITAMFLASIFRGFNF